MIANIMRWASIRGLKEGLLQSGRVDVFDNLGRDEALRPQDYGFAAQPVDGQALVLEVGGHTVIVRQDRLKDRPALGDYEVAIWHKEGHMVKLKAGKVVQVDCDQLVVNATTSVTFNTPLVKCPDGTILAKIVRGVQEVFFGEKPISTHTHGNVQNGSGHSDQPD